ncbi:glycoside hydrolase family 5 protein [Kockovaella imperatae]|uniref:Glycoside hydrolase family 5 protein n=1 Tax=Kockovaella imperatae TaxID=4999 RepID=A0A1Y1ULP5_9TREE|nr:glycoside hydrolase family 5 protein [Kockovaella imperatae]ORX38035.1 glycoside hydrolase family 5 protein [Kockovaella imperatae]
MISAILLALGLVSSTRGEVVNVKIDSCPQQEISSFGASGAWWPNDLIHFPVEQQNNLSHWLFSEDGLYLSSYRYNMGGDGGNDTHQVTTNGSRVESFLLRNGTYDWSRDHAGVHFLKEAQNYSVPYVTFFINAAPSHIATNGAACGWNFTANKTDEYADYMTTVLSHWVDHGIDIKYISPMNEPDNNRSDCGQEGMSVVPALRAPIINTLRDSLDNSSASCVGVIADETSRPYLQGIPENPHWLPEAYKCMSNTAVHDYDYVTDDQLAQYYQQVLNLTGGSPPPIKFTEICCSNSSGNGPSAFASQNDPTMTNALIVARYVWQFLTIANAQSFDWWTAVADLPCSPSIDGEQCATAVNNTAGYNSGLIYIDPNYNQTHDYNLYFTKRAFMMKHFAYFHRPGSVRYDVPSTQLPYGVNAFATKNGVYTIKRSAVEERNWAQTWNVLFFNNQSTSFNMTLEAPAAISHLYHVVKTDPSTDWEEVEPRPEITNGVVNFELPAESLYTLQFCAD